jgi:nucleoside phosphorylase
MEFKERRAPVISIAMIASVLEVGLVVLAAAIFLAMIIAAFAVIVWLMAGFASATHQDPAPRH